MKPVALVLVVGRSAAWWACSIKAATAGSATSHKVETDFTGGNVRSYPATVWVRGRESFVICPASSRASIGSRPCSDRKTREPPRSAPVPDLQPARCAHGQAGCRIDCPNAVWLPRAERADVPIEDLERRAQLGHFLKVAGTEVWPFQLLLSELGNGSDRNRTTLASAPPSPGRRG
jgi:hypothetical protein